MVIRQTIIGRGDVWCVTLTDYCTPVAEEETTRLERERPPEADFGGLYAGFFGGLGAFLLIYLICARCLVPGFGKMMPPD